MSKKIEKTYEKMDFNDWLEKGVLTPPKIKILQSPYKNIVCIGGKGSGKTLIAVLYGIYVMNNEKASVVAMRRWKNQAANNLAKYFYLATKHLESFDIPMFAWKKSIANIQREISKTNSLVNNTFSYHSLEEASSLDGWSEMTLSTIIDEPILPSSKREYLSEKEQQERMEEWEKTISVIKDNCYRFCNAEQKKMIKTWILLNPWDRSAPIMCEAEKISPEADYIKALFNGKELEYYLGNKELVEQDWDILVECFKEHADYMVADEESSTLIVRNNKFSNPTIDEIPVLKDIKRALIENRRQMLTIALGLSSESEIKGNDMVFGNLNPLIVDYKEMLDDGWSPVQSVNSWDIDTTKVLTKTSGVLMRRRMYINNQEAFEYKVVITDIYEIVATGSGVQGELNEVYVKLMNEHTEKYILSMQWDEIPNLVYIDDKRKWFSFTWNKIRSAYIRSISIFQQNGNSGLIERQDIVETGITSKIVCFTKNTLRIIDDMRKLVRKSPYDKKRETSGTINTLDLYDSFEQVPYHFQGFILNDIRVIKK